MEYENVGVKAKSRQEYCGICQDPVYRNDRLDLGKFVLHEQCFRCLKCGLKLTNSNFATYGDVVLCKAHYHQLFQVKGNYTELARQTERYSISGSTERLIQAGEITEEEAKQMMIIQAEVDTMVEERRTSSTVSPDAEENNADGQDYENKANGQDYENYANGQDYENDEVMQEEGEEADSQAYSYSYGGNYRYHTEYDDEAEDEEEPQQQQQQQQGYAYRQQGFEDDDDDEYQNKLDWYLGTNACQNEAIIAFCCGRRFFWYDGEATDKEKK